MYNLQAAVCMQAPGPKKENLENLKKRFSYDILEIELSGPDKSILALLMSRVSFTVRKVYFLPLIVH